MLPWSTFLLGRKWKVLWSYVRSYFLGMGMLWHAAIAVTHTFWVVVLVSQKQLSKPREMCITKHGAAQHVGWPRRGGGESKWRREEKPTSRCCKPSDHQLEICILPPRETLNSIELAVQVMSERYDELLACLSQQDNDMKNLRRRVEKIERNDSTEKDKQFRESVHKLQWRSRRRNLEIRWKMKTLLTGLARWHRNWGCHFWVRRKLLPCVGYPQSQTKFQE